MSDSLISTMLAAADAAGYHGCFVAEGAQPAAGALIVFKDAKDSASERGRACAAVERELCRLGHTAMRDGYGVFMRSLK